MDTALRAVHLLAATVWVGGTIALVFVAVPPVQRLEGEERARTLRAFGERWRPIGWSSLAVAIVTGIMLAAHAHAFDATSTRFDWVLAAKGLLVGLLVGGAYLHDFVLGPRLAAEIREGRPEQTRRPLVLVGWTSFTLTLALPILGVVVAEAV
jgi:putative copper export protein